MLPYSSILPISLCGDTAMPMWNLLYPWWNLGCWKSQGKGDICSFPQGKPQQLQQVNSHLCQHYLWHSLHQCLVLCPLPGPIHLLHPVSAPDLPAPLHCLMMASTSEKALAFVLVHLNCALYGAFVTTHASGMYILPAQTFSRTELKVYLRPQSCVILPLGQYIEFNETRKHAQNKQQQLLSFF